jgi:hypothetical protein
MIATQTKLDRMAKAFKATAKGLPGLTDQILEACVGASVSFFSQGKQIRYCCRADGETSDGIAPLSGSIFRAILARVAVRCNEHVPDSVTPHGGKGVVAVGDDLVTLLAVQFVNTPEKQELNVQPKLSA